MLDHILCYPDAASRPVGPLDDDGRPLGYPSWDDAQGRTWMPVRCILEDVTYDTETGELVTPAVEAPGAWMVVRAAEVQPDLLDDPRCLIVTDEARAARGGPFVVVMRLQPETLLGRIEPVFAGDRYPFPAGPASQLIPLMVVD